MEFEFDSQESRSNKEKHGIDFLEAQTLWRDISRVEIPARTKDEQRTLVIGSINKKYWTAVVTCRGIKTRIISIRRSRPEEVQMYES
jgi:uncharacterized DUF497 family protein